MRKGVLGGSFNPLHFGHINMALALLEAHRLDSVLFCPAFTSPFKAVAPPVAAPQQRLAMLKLGIQRIPHFSLLDWEIKQEGPSYTIDTIKRLKEESEADLFLLLGEDQLPHLHQWKDVQKLFSLCAPLIASREGSPLHLPHLLPTVNALVDRGRTKIPIMEISSTLVRMRLAKKQFCGHLVPDLILDYIAQHRLY